MVARATPQTRSALVRAATIREELRALDYSPIPTLRTIDRVLQRANLTSPRLRLARRLPRSAYPGPQAHDSNEVHQVDLVGPRYLTGQKTKYYFFVCKDAFDQAVYAEFLAGNAMESALSNCALPNTKMLRSADGYRKLEKQQRTDVVSPIGLSLQSYPVNEFGVC